MVLQSPSPMKLSFGGHAGGKLGIVQPNDKNDPAPIPLETCTKTRRDPAPDRRPMARASTGSTLEGGEGERWEPRREPSPPCGARRAMTWCACSTRSADAYPSTGRSSRPTACGKRTWLTLSTRLPATAQFEEFLATATRAYEV